MKLTPMEVRLCESSAPVLEAIAEHHEWLSVQFRGRGNMERVREHEARALELRDEALFLAGRLPASRRPSGGA